MMFGNNIQEKIGNLVYRVLSWKKSQMNHFRELVNDHQDGRVSLVQRQSDNEVER